MRRSRRQAKMVQDKRTMGWLLGRLFQAVVTLAVLSAVLFAALTTVPGHGVEARVAADPGVRPADVQRLARLRGLDRPWYVQYARWAWGFHPPRQPPRLEATVQLEPGGAWTAQVGPAAGTAALTLVPLHSGVGAQGMRLHAQGPSAPRGWIPVAVVEADGLESLLTVWVPPDEAGWGPWSPVSPQQVPHGQPWSMDLRELVPGAAAGVEFRVVRGPGQVRGSTYVSRWDNRGRSVVALEARWPSGARTVAALEVEHDPPPDAAHFVPGVLGGNLGYASIYKRPVAELLQGRVRNTLLLMLPALLLALLLALPLGVWAATRAGSRLDRVLRALGVLGTSTPVFWVGMLLVVLFAVRLRWLPAGGLQTPGEDGAADALRHLVLPVLALVLVSTGRWLRYVRTAVLEALDQDFIRTARAKGLPESVVVWKHALRHALVPLVTLLGLSVPALFSGAVLTETVFAWPGLGRLVLDAVQAGDHYLAMVAFLLSAATVLVGNLVADILCALVDPRVGRPG